MATKSSVVRLSFWRSASRAAAPCVSVSPEETKKIHLRPILRCNHRPRPSRSPFRCQSLPKRGASPSPGSKISDQGGAELVLAFFSTHPPALVRIPIVRAAAQRWEPGWRPPECRPSTPMESADPGRLFADSGQAPIDPSELPLPSPFRSEARHRRRQRLQLICNSSSSSPSSTSCSIERRASAGTVKRALPT